VTPEPLGTAELPARVTTPLLALITQQSLDEDYQHVAEQRRSGTRPPAQRHRLGGRTLAIVLVFGVLLAVAAMQTARDADVASAGREQLISRISARRTSLADLQERKVALQTENASAQAAYDAMGRRLDALNRTRTTQLAATGWAELSGAGVRITVDDAPGGEAAGRVHDDDLALVVNGLWRAGARGVAVNGQRVTALSALRTSGQAIGLNGVSLSPPYTVLAVGDARTLPADFADSTSGARFTSLAAQLGMRFDVEKRDTVRLPAASSGMMALHHATPGRTKQKPSANQEETQ
jgi:uncharacterized protein YlxW (UPF0749 family)